MSLALRSPDMARPLPTAEGKRVVEARHPEYAEFHLTWRWLQDSLEGGQRYREADYGTESYQARYEVVDQDTGQPVPNRYGIETHQLPRRNLVRHPQEYPQGYGPGGGSRYSVEGTPSTDDEYEFRRALTPVPSFVAEAIGAHLARIYAREVRREAPPGPLGDRLAAWWGDVDGSGATIDDWMQESVAPLFLAIGHIDLAFDHPPAPEGERVASRADSLRLDLSRCVASFVLPENVPDWTLAPDRSYRRAVVREWHGGCACYREWTPAASALYDDDGAPIGPPRPHAYRRVPVTRCFDVRKPRCDNVGQSRYEVIAELQRAYYNVDSELTLSNSLAAHPLLSGPEDYCAGQSIKVGPGNVLPEKRTPGGTYSGWRYVGPPSEAADKLAAKLRDYRDAADRAACLTKPAGAQGTDGNTVSQSGVSKMLDQSTGNDLLSKVARSLQRLEMKAAEMALTVLSDGPPPPEALAAVVVEYPTRFDLFTAKDFADLVVEFQAIAADAGGDLPETAGHMLRTYVRLMLPGMDDETYQEIDAEIDAFLEGKASEAARRAEMGPPPALPPPTPVPPAGSSGDMPAESMPMDEGA